jgi:hypothetical protein
MKFKLSCLIVLFVFIISNSLYAFDNLVYPKEVAQKNERLVENTKLKKTYNFLPIKPSKVKNSENTVKKQSHKKKISQNDTSKIGDIFLWISMGFSFTSILFTLFISLIIGLILLFIGLIFLIIGFSLGGGKKKNKTENKSQVLRDMVHLKNGSIIKCQIIEQVVGESIKIKTSDGSIIVYKMDEVLKITKEEE